MDIKNCSRKFFGGNKILNDYLRDIRKYKPLSVDDEVNLFVRIKNGDEKAKAKIIKHNQLFVYSLAKRYAKNEDEVLDYVNEGNIGLITAINNFNVDMGTKFITHAVWYIRRSMNYYLTTPNNMINKSNNMKLSKKIDRVKQKFFAINGREPSVEEIMETVKERYGIEIREKSEVYDVTITSISDGHDEDGNDTFENHTLFNEKTLSENDYEKHTDITYRNMMLAQLMQTLSEEQKEIINMSYGVGYARPYTIDEIAEKFSMERKDIIALKSRTIRYLRQNKEKYRMVI